MENYVIHVGPVETTQESLFFCEKLRDSLKTTWFIKSYVDHEKLAGDFLVKEIAPTFSYIFMTYELILSSFMRNTT